MQNALLISYSINYSYNNVAHLNIYFNLEIIITLCPNVLVYKTGISAYMYILQVGPNYHNVDRFCKFVY